MKSALLLFALITASLFTTTAAMASTAAYPTANVNLRAGPDGGYPLITVLHRGEDLELFGCIRTLQWCEVRTLQNERGWVYAPYLRSPYGRRNISIIDSYNRGNTRIVIFDARPYWDNHYRGKSFYRDHGRWIRSDDWDRYDDHGGWHRDYDDDDDDHHGHGRSRGRDDDDRDHRSRTGGHSTKSTIPTTGPGARMKMPGGDDYNPLCPMGQSVC